MQVGDEKQRTNYSDMNLPCTERSKVIKSVPASDSRLQISAFRKLIKLIPDDGIYAELVEVDKVIHKGMLYLEPVRQ